MASSEANAIWGQKIRDFQGPPLPMPLVMDVARLKTIEYKLHIKNRYIGNYMYMGLVAAVLCVVVRRYCYGRWVWFADLPSPSHSTVVIQGWMVGVGGSRHIYIVTPVLTLSQRWHFVFCILSKEEFCATCIPVEMRKVWSAKLL
jgi:hypothetical protein